jgi:hypothetical protein
MFMSSGVAQSNPEQVATALTAWLQQEIVNSDAGRNGYLSKFQDRRDDFHKPFDDPSNFQSQKAKSHYDRLIQWVCPYDQDDLRHDDWFAGRLVFAGLMEVSGSYRKQCFLEATDTSDYIQRRHDHGPTGIDMFKLSADELASERVEAINAMNPDERISYIIDRTLLTGAKSLGLHESLHPPSTILSHLEGRLEAPDSAPVRAMKESQKIWAGLALAHIVVAASFRDNDYSKVPLLEPESITDVKNIIYPFIRA